MSAVNQPLLDTIEPDEDIPRAASAPPPLARSGSAPAAAPTSMASNQSDAENGIAGIFRQSSHPVALFFLYAFRLAAVVMYMFSYYVIDNYVAATVTVVVLLAMDFWNCRNVSGRTLVGLRFWNQVDEDGESYWVFESRDPNRPANPIDSRMFWIALYSFPFLWVALLLLAVIKFNFSYIPIVILALVFNMTNVIGFTYADRDAKSKWANGLAGGALGLPFGIGGQLIGGAVRSGFGRVFGGS
ncbi:Golgi apparatus membrane protein TVP23 [Auriculariales sp. MPI-PUGE-AT-0066]|nr:Golgi apparatus membrane protein TVP23 [Auriculariales sp. MPI-PUGE-AT-0066]